MMKKLIISFKKLRYKLKILLTFSFIKFLIYVKNLLKEFRKFNIKFMILIFLLIYNFFPAIFIYFLYFFLVFKVLPTFFYPFAMKAGNSFTMYFGLPGSGKTTIAAAKSLEYKNVWSNVSIKGCYSIDIQNDLGVYNIENGLLIIDEAGIEHNNRDFKNFQTRILKWYKKHRHYNIDIVYFSQGFDDVDKKLRDLTSELHLTNNFTRFFILTKPIIKYVGVDPMSNQITFLYKLAPFWRFKPFIPSKYWKLFKTHQKDPLLPKKWARYQ